MKLKMAIAIAMLLVLLVSCGGGEEGGESRGPGGGRGGHPGGPPGAGGPERGSTSVPVEVAAVERRTISQFLETNGTLEAENEVDLVARMSAPITELLVEEGMAVRRGQLLARLDQAEARADVEISRLALGESTLIYERAKALYEQQLISEETFEQALSDFETVTAQLAAAEIQFAYTELKAPFDGLIITRYVDFAQQVSVNTPLFRLSDFDPLLCPIQVPERELNSLRVGQPAFLELESWPDRRFDARVLRVSPVVDSATGTVKVTLEVDSKGNLRPGMFARVFLETAVRDDALVVPKVALSLESIGDTVYVAQDGVASRREVALGYREGDFVQISDGVTAGELVIVVGHDGLSHGTPVEILRGATEAETTEPAGEEMAGRRGRGGDGSPGRGPGGRPGGRPDFASMTPEQLERAKEMMRGRGMTDAQIDVRIKGEAGSR
jgi:membrane fusion protein (multidrug efflux system)